MPEPTGDPGAQSVATEVADEAPDRFRRLDLPTMSAGQVPGHWIIGRRRDRPEDLDE
jgi:hypothetical protein